MVVYNLKPAVFVLTCCSQFVCRDNTVSQKHLRIRCIVFNEDEIDVVPPLVYADDFSSNGTLIESSMRSLKPTQRRVIGSVLLRHGDKLQLSRSISLYYFSQSGRANRTSLLNELHLKEIEVLLG